MKTEVQLLHYVAEFLLEREMFDRKVVEKISCSITFCENRGVCEIMWNNNIEPDRPQMTI
jgi:hypothetical protein